jgi:uncharacterized membrane protein YdjX (TVP38/TMEM64 family)
METGPREPQKRARLWPLATLAVVSVIAIALAIGWLSEGRLVGPLQALHGWTAAHPILAIAVYGVVATAAQCIIAPTGSLLMIAGGYFLGYVAAPVFFAGTLISGAIVHTLSGYPVMANLAERVARNRGSQQVRAYLASLSERITKRPILLSAMLRPIPVLPAAATAFLTRQLGINGWAVFLGTLLAGWIRPLSYAALGASLPNVELLADPATMLQSANLPVLAISSSVLIVVTLGWLVMEAMAVRNSNRSKKSVEADAG